MRVVLDTNVLVAALRSPTGASRRILRLLRLERLEAVGTVPLVLEYEAVLKRPDMLLAAGLTGAHMDVVIDQIAKRLTLVPVDYLWRPQLRDPDDEMVLEAAVNGHAGTICTFNRSDFEPAAGRFGVRVEPPSIVLNAWRRQWSG